VLAAVVTSGVLIWKQRIEPDDQRALLGYFRTTFVELHAQTKSVQGGLALLVDGEETTASTAASVLRENTVPTIDYLLEQAGQIVVDDPTVRELHAGYIEALRGMRADALEMINIFSTGDGDDSDKRRTARARVVAIADRFTVWQQGVADTWAEHGIMVTLGADAGPTTD
jgi:hypothetical protein